MKPFYTDWDEFKDAQLCNAWVATAIVGSAAIGAGASIYAAKTAQGAQQDAAKRTADIQQGQYLQTRADLAPYRDAGVSATTELQSRLPYLTSDIDVTGLLNDPNSTPAKAYNFTRTQGLKAVQNSAAARGLGNSGAALKGAANFATGLADNTYTNLFNLENINRTNAYTRLKGLIDVGENAGAMTGVLGEKAAYNTGTAITAGGNAGATGANATGGAINSFANNVGGYAAYKGLYGSNGSGGQVSSVPSPNNALYTGDPTIPGFA